MVSKAHAEIDYWRNGHSEILKTIESLEKEIKELKCKLKEKE